MRITGWGRSRVLDACTITPRNKKDVLSCAPKLHGIARGFGRSYGDSSLADSVLLTHKLNNILSFDKEAGIIEVEAGVGLDDLLQQSVPSGWFIPVTPGTKYMSVGGAISADVHGKNHHEAGCLSQFILEVSIVAEKGMMCCTPQDELFHAICGGMGLVGVIYSAKIKLCPIKNSYIDMQRYQCDTLQQVIEHLNDTKHPYSVAWLDLTGKKCGRGVVEVGKHSEQGILSTHKKARLKVPDIVPSWLINAFTVYLFNQLYFSRCKSIKMHLHYDDFFYPLDKIQNWNKLYGKRGFVQYQFVVSSKDVLCAIIEMLSSSKYTLPLAVLKNFGEQNDNFLSFPKEGYSLAVDIKCEKGLESLLHHCNQRVMADGGRVYLAKDHCMQEDFFKHSYPQWQKIVNIREKFGFEKLLSEQAKRLKI